MNAAYKLFEEISKLPISQANLELIKIYKDVTDESLRGAIRTKLGELNLGIICKQVGRRYNRFEPKLKSRIQIEELQNEAMMRFLQYVPDTYDHEKGKLSTYMTKCVNQAVNKVVEDTLWTVYIPRQTNRDRYEISQIGSTDHGELSRETTLTAKRIRKALEVPKRIDFLEIENIGFDDPTIREVMERETPEKMKSVLSCLDKRQFFILSLHHGLGYGPEFDGHEYMREDEKPYRDIGESMGTSWQNVQQLERKAFAKLARREEIRQMAGH